MILHVGPPPELCPSLLSLTVQPRLYLNFQSLRFPSVGTTSRHDHTRLLLVVLKGSLLLMRAKGGLLTKRPSSLPRASLSRLQDEELLGHLQSTILQVQGDCEKLNITTSNLIEDHLQKQKDIEVSRPRAPGVEPRLIPPCPPLPLSIADSACPLTCGSPGAVSGPREAGEGKG